MTTLSLAVDAGQSGCRMRAVVDGRLGDIVETDGLPEIRPPEAALAAVIGGSVREAVRRAPRNALQDPGNADQDPGNADQPGADHVCIDMVAVGMTGLYGNPADAERLLDECRRLFAVRHVVVADDAVTSYLGAVGLEPGVVVAAGTGSVAFACDAREKSARVDGWGFELGDAGSGYWIGRKALRAAFREFDGRGGSKALAEAAACRYGPLHDLPATLFAAPDAVRRVAAFAKDVADVANSGDAEARRIWREAGTALAESAVAAARRAGIEQHDCLVACTGSIAGAGSLLLDSFEEHVRAALPNGRLIAPRGSSLDGAVTLAADPHARALAEFVREAARSES